MYLPPIEEGDLGDDSPVQNRRKFQTGNAGGFDNDIEIEQEEQKNEYDDDDRSRSVNHHRMTE